MKVFFNLLPYCLILFGIFIWSAQSADTLSVETAKEEIKLLNIRLSTLDETCDQMALHVDATARCKSIKDQILDEIKERGNIIIQSDLIVARENVKERRCLIEARSLADKVGYVYDARDICETLNKKIESYQSQGSGSGRQ